MAANTSQVQVVDCVTGKPIAGATVTFSQEVISGYGVFTVITDSNGMAGTNNFDVDQFIFALVSMAGYFPAYSSSVSPGGGTTVISLQAKTVANSASSGTGTNGSGTSGGSSVVPATILNTPVPAASSPAPTSSNPVVPTVVAPAMPDTDAIVQARWVILIVIIVLLFLFFW